ncbi:MAG: VOC family protein [Planctomycetes bacterium]|nr:VOC family protein [Planctomycetota bacterium]
MGNARLHHVGIIVRDEAQLALLLSVLGLGEGHRQFVPEYEAECVFTQGSGAGIEFIIPRGGKLAGFSKGLGGLHHIAIEVDDLAARSRELRAAGVELLEGAAVEAGELRINFVPPVYTRGVIVELVERVPRSA